LIGAECVLQNADQLDQLLQIEILEDRRIEVFHIQPAADPAVLQLLVDRVRDLVIQPEIGFEIQRPGHRPQGVKGLHDQLVVVVKLVEVRPLLQNHPRRIKHDVQPHRHQFRGGRRADGHPRSVLREEPAKILLHLHPGFVPDLLVGHHQARVNLRQPRFGQKHQPGEMVRLAGQIGCGLHLPADHGHAQHQQPNGHQHLEQHETRLAGSRMHPGTPF
jgi:hypothetical protein